MVFLVPAHGPNNVTRGKRDPGARGSGTDEAAVSADLTAAVAPFLDAFTDVALVPSGTLAERVAWLIARMGASDWAFSLHMNAGGGTGSEVVYDDQKPQLRDEAATLSRAVSAGLGLPDRGPKPDSATPRKYLGLVSRPAGRVFIVETAFQDRPSDVAAVQTKGPRAVAEAIRQVMGLAAPSTPLPPLLPTGPFVDIAPDDRDVALFASAKSLAASHGSKLGYDDGTIRPDEPLTMRRFLATARKLGLLAP